MAATLFDKIWKAHVVATDPETDVDLVYIDRHLLHEVGSYPAFEKLKRKNRKARRPLKNMAAADHTVRTKRSGETAPAEAGGTADTGENLVAALVLNTDQAGIPCHSFKDDRYGIVHVVAPEEGAVLPGTTVVCCDRQVSTGGAFGSFSFGISGSDVEHALATQTVWRRKPKNMRVSLSGTFMQGVTVKDFSLFLVHTVGSMGALGYVIEFTGPLVSAMSMEERMTLCNMGIETGATAAVVAPDPKTIEYLKDRFYAPSGDLWKRAVLFWETLRSDKRAAYDKEYSFDVTDLEPFVTWGTSADQGMPISAIIPSPFDSTSSETKKVMEKALVYMGLQAGQQASDIVIDHVFIGSCTNGRIEDLRQAAALLNGKRISPSVKGYVVPGSQKVKRQAEREGLHTIFTLAGFEWRSSGCSFCSAVNEDIVPEGARSISTSNRNYEGCQGHLSRTHLASPLTAAASAVIGYITDPRAMVGR